ncbi:MAG TPA: 30S ribosome-binding factor RbfA [Steroidobacteraceae bacterium]
MPREVPRARRVAEQVQRVLSQLLLREVRDPRLKPMTVTHVKVSPDLTHIWVNYTLLAGNSHDELQKEILDEAALYLRGPLGRALRLRLAPQLHFAVDEELERGNQLDDLITRAVREDQVRHVDDPSEGTLPGLEDPKSVNVPDYDSSDDEDDQP